MYASATDWESINGTTYMLYLNIASFSIDNSNFQIFSKNIFLHFNSYKILWKMEHLLLRSKCSIFHNILKKSYISKASKGACVE